MTHASSVPPLEAGDIDRAEELLRARGHRVSAARRLVLTALFAADGPVSAEEIAGGLGGRVQRLDVTSVYRNLETFEHVGLVRHVHLGHGPGRYRLAGADENAYALCERCERVDVVDPAVLDEVRATLERGAGYEASFLHFPIVGVCARCLEQGE